MSTIEHDKLVAGDAIAITNVRHVQDYTLDLTFSDGTNRIINFETFLRASSHPEIRLFLEPTKFAGYVIKDGDLIWGDYELCFPIADLHDGTI
jgi:hypothetical protein